jgi:hypothetical protein
MTAAINQSIAMALGHWGNCNSNGNGATAMEIDRPFATGRWIDRNCNGAGAAGATARQEEWGNGATAMGQEDWGNCNGNGDRSYFDRVATATATARRNGATAMAKRSNSNGERGNGDDGSIVFNGTPAIDQSIAMAPGQGHWGKSNRTVLQ